MIFRCLPPKGKCEWAHLRDFVIHYNEIYEKAYTRSKCLDVDERNTKIPEILLESPGEIPVAIERKSVVWPEMFFSDHHNEHYFSEKFVGLLGDSFKDGLYQLIIDEDSLKGRKKKEVETFAENIAQKVLSNPMAGKIRQGLSGVEPIPWCFRSPHLYEIDETFPKSGVGVAVWGKSWLDDPEDILQAHQRAKQGYALEFAKTLNKTAGKFENYQNCLKLLIVQFYGDALLMIDEDVIEIVQSASLPELIDQVWLVCPVWINEEDYQIGWERVR